MTDINDPLFGFRVWEVQKNMIPKVIREGNMEDLEDGTRFFDGLDLDNKTYAIRIGRYGLK